MTRVFFVRHAQPEFSHTNDEHRPLNAEGFRDRSIVLETLKDKKIDAFLCSTYKRSIDTILETAEYYQMEVQTDARFRERVSGPRGNAHHDAFRRRWEDLSWHEEGGESIRMVQERNIEALQEALERFEGRNIVIGTHGTALSAILNYYRPEFGCEDFLRIIDWMPYIIELDFEGQKLVGMQEHAHVYKEFKGVDYWDKLAEKKRKEKD